MMFLDAVLRQFDRFNTPWAHFAMVAVFGLVLWWLLRHRVEGLLMPRHKIVMFRDRGGRWRRAWTVADLAHSNADSRSGIWN